MAFRLECPSVHHKRYCDLATDPVYRKKILARAVEVRSPFPSLPPDGRVRVGIITPCAGLGGAEFAISNLLVHCDPTKVRWVGIVVRQDHGLPNLIDEWGKHCKVVVGEPAIRSLAPECDVIYSWGILDLPWGFPPSRLAQLVPAEVPIITCSQGSLEYDCHNDPEAISHAIPVAVSKAALRSVPKAKRDQARIIYNLASPDRIKPTRPVAETRKLLGISEGVKVAGWLGRLSPEKGPWNFALGIAALPDGWVGLMAGGGAEWDRVAGLADRLPKGKLRLIGPREDIGDLLSIFDCLVMPSQTEGASLAAAEAWLAGVPLISTRVGVLEDEPGLARLLPDNPTGRDIARAVLDDQADPEGTRARVERAQRFARVDMGVERFDRQWCDLFREVSGPIAGPDLCDCGDGVWVGAKVACDEQRSKFDRVIHFWRDDAPESSCEYVHDSGRDDGRNLLIHWKEVNPVEAVEALIPSLAEIVEFAKPAGRLLIHCNAGMTRSPTIALACKIDRGCDPVRAEADIRAAFVYRRYGKVAWHEHLMRDVAEKVSAMMPPGETERSVVVATVVNHATVRPRQAQPAINPVIIGAVNSCPSRGSELSVSDSSYEGCCSGATKWACAAGKGKIKGKTTLAECCQCQAIALL